MEEVLDLSSDRLLDNNNLTHQVTMLTAGILLLQTFLIFHSLARVGHQADQYTYVYHILETKNITFCIGPISIVGVSENSSKKTL